ncbi:hypothetical protein Bca101_022147 [Brassica carinata]
MPSSFNTGASLFAATNLHVPATSTPQLAWFKSLGLQSGARRTIEECFRYLPRTSRACTQRHATLETPPKPSKHSPLPPQYLQRRVGLTTTLDQESQNLQGCQAHHHIISYQNNMVREGKQRPQGDTEPVNDPPEPTSPSVSFKTEETKLSC